MTNDSAPPGIAAETASRVAIIGGGQLGFLLCKAARKLGIRTLIVTPDAAAPALTAADDSIICPYDSPQLAERLASSVDVVTFEFEAVPDVLLLGLEEEMPKGSIAVRPDPAVLRLVKNKARQKAWLRDQRIPTAAFQEISEREARNKDFVATASFPLVQKTQEGGYDGLGVQIIHDAAKLDQLWPVPSIIETYLSGARELAVVVARSVSGEVEIYPAVEMVVDQGLNLLDVVIAPAELPDSVHEGARSLARSVIERLECVGVLAVELFLTSDGELLVNEISPRVHNSGHHTLESCAVSQFEQHIRAVTGMSLAKAEQSLPSVMKNIIYDDSLSPLVGLSPGRLSTENESVRFHWYGKQEARPGRKMGHITCVGADGVSGRRMILETLENVISFHGDG
ncbi:MAG: 5-(carboxyamino)imidazole ribonucleotide synthase [Gammaproteobacteria bacterium]